MITHPIISNVVNQHRITDSDRKIIRAVYHAFSEKCRTAEFRLQRKVWYGQALKLHHQNNKTYLRIVKGN